MVRENYPQFYDFYLSLAPAIKKADFCRFLYMHRYGGVYVDLDFVCLKNLSPLLRGYDIVLGRLSEDNDYYQIPNAFMASRPEHKFWMQVAWDAMRAPPAEQAIESHAGPLRLQWAYQVYQPKRSIVYGDELIYPFDWIHFTSWSNGKYYRADRKRLAMELRGKKPEEIAEVFPHSYCLTFWTHNW